jgi:hypothetical protein
MYSSLLGIINKELTPAGRKPPGSRFNMYEINMRRNRSQFQKFVEAAREHENMGVPGRPRTGHSGLMSLFLKTKTGNVNATLETVAAPRDNEFENEAGQVIVNAEKASWTAVGDRATQTIGTYTVYFWKPAGHDTGRWIPRRCSVPGGCEG